MPSQTLRPYQLDCLNEARKLMASGKRRVVIAAPTGAGKTSIAAYMVKNSSTKGHKILFLAHRKELIDQCSKRLDGEEIPHGIIKAGNDRVNDFPVQVASKDTIVRRLGKYPKGYFTFIIVDECHRTLGNSYQKILDHYPTAFLVGLSATPYRLDGRGLGAAYDAIVKCSSMQDLIDQGFLVEPRIFSAGAPSLDGVKTIAGDYSEKELEKIYDKPTLIGDLYSHFDKHCRNRLTIIFAVSVQHSKAIKELFSEKGVKIEHLDGTTPDHEREVILENFQNRNINVITNVGILTEGYDCPEASAIILARPTQSTSLYLQMAGRVLRTAPGKLDCIILDHAGNVQRHGFPQDDREFSLDNQKKQKPKDPEALSISTCEKCYAIYKGAKCPACGEIPVPKQRVLKQVDGELRELSKSKKLKTEKETYIWLLEEAKRYNKSTFWASREFHKLFDKWPRFKGIGPKKVWESHWENGKLRYTLKEVIEND